MRRFLRGLGWTFIGLGAFVLYFLVYQLVGTNVETNRNQASLRGQLEREWAGTNPSSSGKATQRAVPRRVPLGSGLAIMQIPKIQLRKIVVEGVGRDDLRKGPGHVPTTVLPGQAGTFGVSGHRTTYGAPFYRLNELAKGDTISVVTRDAIYTYKVTHLAVVLPTDVEVLDNVPGPDGKPKATITLTTCNPRYSARQRLVVFGDLASTTANSGRVVA